MMGERGKDYWNDLYRKDPRHVVFVRARRPEPGEQKRAR